MNFRKDINGLRAIAVIGVVLFHIDNAILPGGFIGVDIFFVISGFLMTSIIMTGLQERNFSIVNFYKSRTKRILPALTTLCTILLIFGFFALPPSEYKILSHHIFSSLGFYSNFTYLNEINYFNDLPNKNWLLHTWSLSLEWQFYLIYPLLLIIATKVATIKRIQHLLYGFFLLSFFMCIFISKKNINYSFYMLPTRSWEMLAGGIAYLYTPNIKNQIKMQLSKLGIILILISYLFISKSDVWPGYLCLIPVLGAVLIIWSSNNNSFLLGNKISQYLGNFSYSIYLWHWPMIILLSTHKINYLYIKLVSIFIISLTFYFLIEKRKIHKNTLALTITVTIVILVLSLSAYKFDGLKWRVDSKYAYTDEEFHKKLFGGAGYPTNIFFSIGALEKEQPDFIIIGDSYGHQYSKSIDKISKDNGLLFEALFDHGCIILENVTTYINSQEDIACSDEYKKVQEKLHDLKTTPLIVAYSWDRYFSKSGMKNGSRPINYGSMESYLSLINDELEKFVIAGGNQRKYYLIGVQQRADYNAISCLSSQGLIFGNSCMENVTFKENPANIFLEEFSKKHSNIFYLDPNKILCAQGNCLVIYNGWPIHSDSAHLSVFGTDLVAPYIISEITKN